MGTRRTVLMVPGLVCDEALYAPQREALGGSVDVVVPDVSRGMTLGEMAQAVLAVAPPRFALLGLSMGGYVAFEVLRQAGQRVEALALLDTSARPESAAQTERRRALVDLAARSGFPAMLDALWPAEVARASLPDGRLRAQFDAMAGRFGPEVFRRQQEAIIGRADSRPDLAGIDLPTLVLCGREDAITPVDGHEEMAAGIRGAHLVVLGDCGHLSTWEQPRAVTAALREWLAL